MKKKDIIRKIKKIDKLLLEAIPLLTPTTNEKEVKYSQDILLKCSNLLEALLED